MTGLPAIPTMLWHAMPPELNTARLMAGAGAAPMLQAAAGWEAFAILLETQADELAASLTALTSAWSGTAGEAAVQATMPMVIWLRTVSLQAQKRALQAAAQAAAYTTAMATTPQLAEIALNHVTHAVLEATNFFGINTIPIGFNEADYERMRELAACVMDGYQFETATNTTFEMCVPAKPIVIPGISAVAGAMAVARSAALLPVTALREAAIAQVSAQGTLQIAQLNAGRVVGGTAMVATTAEGQAQKAHNAGSHTGQQQAQQNPMQQGVQMATQMATQVGSTLTQLPQQMGQMATQPMQQLMQPLQQMTSLFSSTGSDKAQMGLIGASPLSNHPLTGGSGASTGAGLVRAASLPGAGGTGARTPLMSNLLGSLEGSGIRALAPGAAGAGAGGLAPVGSGGGGAPMGMMGQNGKSGGKRPGLQVPTPLAYELGEDEDDDW